MLDKSKFIESMTGLCELYNKTPSEFLYDLYYNIFKDYSLEEFNMSIDKCLRNRVYNTLPKPAELLSYLEGTSDDKALIAWNKVIEAVSKGAYYQTIEFDDPIISHCVVELGGWMWLCSQDEATIPFIEKRFIDLYRLNLKRGIAESVKVIGFIEARNSGKGYLSDIPKPVKIGQKKEQEKLECDCKKVKK